MQRFLNDAEFVNECVAGYGIMWISCENKKEKKNE